MVTYDAVLPRWHARAATSAAPALALDVEPLTDVAALEPSWRALEAEADPSFFLTWAWIGTLLATLRGSAFIVRATLGRDTVGLASWSRTAPASTASCRCGCSPSTRPATRRATW